VSQARRYNLDPTLPGALPLEPVVLFRPRRRESSRELLCILVRPNVENGATRDSKNLRLGLAWRIALIEGWLNIAWDRGCRHSAGNSFFTPGRLAHQILATDFGSGDTGRFLGKSGKGADPMSIADEKSLALLARNFTPPSDREVETRIRQALDRSRYHALRFIYCAYQGGVLTLQGSVESYYLKQIAQSVALTQLRGGVIVENQILVENAAAHAPDSRSTGV
jgi:hypothetical protein